ncbi:MAG TPA: 4-alpha-glucanotransferase [Solirubrobacteraceae bacterium]|nr:4-alpha-glucanotransferase [Solirubrobacteraceae bacterium]
MLLHPTSLPGARLGDEARAFVDWLAAAGQSWWQTLPLGPPDEHGSPYAARSAFAADPALLADPDAPVTGAERDALRARAGFWLEDWEAFGGDVDMQVRLDREWGALRAYARGRGVRLLGDIPIYVAPGGADHRAHPELFRTGFVAGAPPDAYSEDGQHWGNPLFDWPAMRRRGYRWWVARLLRNLELFDAARIDHFRGFVAYWAIPEGDETARRGHWMRGPGAAPFRAMRAALGGDLPLVAEDLGVITEPVRRLRDELGLPGTVVTQFGFDRDDPGSPHRFDNQVRRAVAYSSTHDSAPAAGWWAGATGEQRDEALAAFARAGVAEREPHWAMVDLTLRSRAATAIVQAQDLLGLGDEARMNVPGTEGAPNWRWRLEPGALDAALARRLRRLSEAAGRAAGRS